ncbi:MAG: biotin/lipoyl-containing protein, partial [Acidobacteriota bacterium]
MPTEVLMPQMGESIAEGTISRWLVKEGDRVERDQPLLEIATDKVDAEIPSPASGVLQQIIRQEGETVPVNEVVGLIGDAADQPAAAAAQPAAAAPPQMAPPQPAALPPQSQMAPPQAAAA